VEPIGSESRIAARLRIVEEHVRLENQHDLDGIMGTFGAAAHYDDAPWAAHYPDREGVRAFYADLLRAYLTCTSRCSGAMRARTPSSWR
jgi:hypothetical protein